MHASCLLWLITHHATEHERRTGINHGGDPGAEVLFSDGEDLSEANGQENKNGWV